MELHGLQFWQELDRSVIASKGIVRLTSLLVCDSDYRPVSYVAETGRDTQQIYFEGERVTVVTGDDESLSRQRGGADFLLAGNMLPQLAIKIRLLLGSGLREYSGAMFSPDLLTAVPFQVQIDGQLARTNFGDELVIDEDGWIASGVTSEPGVRIFRVSRPTPRWRGRSTARVQYRAPNSVRVSEATISISDAPLGGSLVEPAGDRPAIAAALFLGGSGHHDRHGVSGELDLGYHDLLDWLAARGVASLRLDSLSAEHALTATEGLRFADLIEYASASLSWLADHPRMRSLPRFLIGHSQGGWVAMSLGTRDVAGVVLIGTAGRRWKDVVSDQLLYLSGVLDADELSLDHWREEQRKFVDAILDDNVWASEDIPAKYVPFRELRFLYRDLLLFDPVKAMLAVRTHVLIVQGDADSQVSTEDAALLQSAASARGLKDCRSDLMVLPDLDHLLRRRGSEPAPRAYFDRRRRVSKGAAHRIYRWIADISLSNGS